MVYSVEYLAVYFIAGVVAATLATMSGVGGGVFFVPIFALALGYPIYMAVGTSKAVVAIVTAIGGFTYLRRGMASRIDALIIASSMIPSAALGAWAVAYVDPALIELVVSIFIIMYSIRLIYRSFSGYLAGDRESIESVRYKGGGASKREGATRGSMAVKALSGVIAGLIAGLTGTGGGGILVPILTGILGMGLKEAVATSTLSIFPSSLAAALIHVATDTVDPLLWVSFAPGAALGALVGPRLVGAISVSKLRIVVGLVLLVVGARMALEALYGSTG